MPNICQKLNRTTVLCTHPECVIDDALAHEWGALANGEPPAYEPRCIADD